MLACVDVQYADASATAACLAFDDWSDAKACREHVITSIVRPAEYESGELYRRELPYALAVLGELSEPPSLVIVDGYVWLGEGRPGLGAHLHAALGCAVVGVAKSRFRSADAIEVHRESKRPLFITAVGVEPLVTARNVRVMHGAFRIPTLLRRVDQLARGLCEPVKQ